MNGRRKLNIREQAAWIGRLHQQVARVTMGFVADGLPVFRPSLHHLVHLLADRRRVPILVEDQ
jgi:hypothetical protein